MRSTGRASGTPTFYFDKALVPYIPLTFPPYVTPRVPLPSRRVSPMNVRAKDAKANDPD